MDEDAEKYTRVTTHDGTVLIVQKQPSQPPKKPNLIDLLPDPRKAALEGTGIHDNAVSAAWLYGENGKAPR